MSLASVLRRSIRFPSAATRRARPRVRLESLGDRVTPSAGAPDLTFGADGRVTTPIGHGSDGGRAVAVQADGKVVVAAGDFNGTDGDFALVRYNPDGSLDPTFGGDGRVTTDLGASDTPNAVAVQADGRIVVAGWLTTSIPDQQTTIAVARYLPDGRLDPTFGAGGTVTTPFDSGPGFAADVAVQPDGKVVVAGAVRGSEPVLKTFALVRYNPDGSLDSTFDGDGRVTTDFGHGNDFASGLALQPDGKIVAVGSVSDGTTGHFGAARYNPDGSLDPTFDGDGMVVTPMGGTISGANTVAVQADGRIVVGGQLNYQNLADLALVRYEPDGSLDPSFGTGGRVVTDVAGSYDFADRLALTGGKVVMTGHSFTGTSWDFEAVRYDADGSLDWTFNGDGKVTTDVNNSIDFAAGVAVQADGKVVVAGTAGVGSGPEAMSYVAVVRYVPTGFLDPTFDGDGRVVTAIRGGDNVATALAVQPDGKVVAVGWATRSNHDFAVARYLADGALDLGFGVGGKVATGVGFFDDAAAGVAVQADGKIVAAGRTSNGTDDDFALARYLANGSLDPSFGTGGLVTTAFGGRDAVGGVVVQADGKILVAGYTDAAGGYDFALARYNPDGSLDPTFDGDGEVVTDFGAGADAATALAVQADGKILAAGRASDGTADAFALAQYNPDGSPDLSFGGGTGRVTTGFGGGDAAAYGLAVQADGEIVLAGSATAGPGDTDFALARYLPDGTLDPTFDGDGRAVAGIAGRPVEVLRGVALQPDGKVVAAGYAGDATRTDLALARFNPDGSPDATFDGDGRSTVSVGAGASAGYAVAVQPNGRIVAAGSASNGTDLDFAVVRVRGDNRAPVPVPTTLTLAEDTTLAIANPAYVADPDGDPVTVELLCGPAHGRLALDPTGAFTYTPDPDFNGADRFAYKASDGFGGFDVGSVGFNVTPVDDPVPPPPEVRVEVKADPALPGKASLFVTGTDAGETLVVRPRGLSRTAYVVSVDGGPPRVVTGVTGRVYVAGLGGDDTIWAAGVRVPVVLDGGAGNDTLTAGSGNDRLTGGPGDDVMDGGAGRDRLVEAGDVDFTLVQGTARLDGRLTGLGDDVLVRNRIEEADLAGGPGANRLDASAFPGRTWLRGGAGDDTLWGGPAADVLLGGDGNDRLYGGAGRDLLVGGAGADELLGGAGDDLLVGGSTAHDDGPAALDAIMAEWLSTAGYAARAGHLEGARPGGRNGNYRLTLTTVRDTDVGDGLIGQDGLDWFADGPSDSSDPLGPERVLSL
jgi:uncharacterized delta-60 repeat protein